MDIAKDDGQVVVSFTEVGTLGKDYTWLGQDGVTMTMDSLDVQWRCRVNHQI